MAKLVLTDVANITGNPTEAANAINANSDAIAAALENTLSRDGTAPNTMSTDLDMNSNRILNLPDATLAQEPVTKAQLDAITTLDPTGYSQVGHTHVVADVTDYVSATNALIAAGTASIVSSGLPDGDKGDIVVSGSGTVFTIDTGVVTTTKMGGDVTTAGKTLLTDADAAAQLASIGAAAASHVHAATDITSGDLDDARLSANVPLLDAATNNFTGDLQVGGVSVGLKTVPQNSQSANYTLVLTDSGKHIYHPVAGGAGHTFTIPANASVAYPIGTVLTFVNMDSANSISIAINTDTMYLAGAGTTGTRTLGTYGQATALKVTSTNWLISGTDLT